MGDFQDGRDECGFWAVQHEYETRAKTPVGTWAYMPPEILSGRHSYDAKVCPPCMKGCLCSKWSCQLSTQQLAQHHYVFGPACQKLTTGTSRCHPDMHCTAHAGNKYSGEVNLHLQQEVILNDFLAADPN